MRPQGSPAALEVRRRRGVGLFTDGSEVRAVSGQIRCPRASLGPCQGQMQEVGREGFRAKLFHKWARSTDGVAVEAPPESGPQEKSHDSQVQWDLDLAAAGHRHGPDILGHVPPPHPALKDPHWSRVELPKSRPTNPQTGRSVRETVASEAVAASETTASATVIVRAGSSLNKAPSRSSRWSGAPGLPTRRRPCSPSGTVGATVSPPSGPHGDRKSTPILAVRGPTSSQHSISGGLGVLAASARAPPYWMRQVSIWLPGRRQIGADGLPTPLREFNPKFNRSPDSNVLMSQAF